MKIDKSVLYPARQKNPVKIGLDAETLYWDKDGGSLPGQQLALCFSYGTEEQVKHIVATAPGRFNPLDLVMLQIQVEQDDVVVIGHNALKFDLPLLNGTLIYNGLRPLKEIRCKDTINNLKNGRAYSNALRALSRRYNLRLKEDSPDWRKVVEGDRTEWKRMVDYCDTDVICALQLERALAKAGVPVPISTWSPRRSR